MNNRERAARRAGRLSPTIEPGKPPNAPRGEYEASRAKQARIALAVWTMQTNLARIGQAACAAAGLAGLLFSGWHMAVLGAVGVWMFGTCKPPPSDELDRFTDRKGR